MLKSHRRIGSALVFAMALGLSGWALGAGLAPYPSLEAAQEEIRSLGEKHPDQVQVFSIGQSALGREVLALKIGKGDGKERPAALVGGGIHGDEYIGNRAAMAVADLLVSGDPLAARVLEKMDVYMVPLINPDGYAATWESEGKGPTKETRTNGHGVDLNRNFGKPAGNIPLPLGYSGSKDPDSDRFVGPKPYSEPESQNIRRLAQEKHFFADVDFHSSGGLIIPVLCDDRESQRGLRKMANVYRQALRDRYIISMFPWRLPLYQGSMEEGLYREAGTLAVLIELGKSGDFKRVGKDKNHFWAFNPSDPAVIKRVADDNARATLTALYAAYHYTGGQTQARPIEVQ